MIIRRHQQDLMNYLAMAGDNIKAIWAAKTTWRIIDDTYALMEQCEELWNMFPQDEAIWTYRQSTFDGLYTVLGRDGDYHAADSAIRQSTAMIADAIHVKMFGNVTADWGAYDGI